MDDEERKQLIEERQGIINELKKMALDNSLCDLEKTKEKKQG
jgi:hypothetical protein